MRLKLTIAAIVALAVTTAQGGDPGVPHPAAPTEEAIINIRGSSFTKLLAQFGTPADFKPIRRKTPADLYVLFDYGSFGFLVRDKKVRTCFIWSEWKDPIRGIKIGDSREQVAKVLGAKPRYTEKDKDGNITAYGYDLQGIDACFFANFDEDGKLERVEISEP